MMETAGSVSIPNESTDRGQQAYKVGIFVIKTPDNKDPNYTGVTYLPSGQVMLVDYQNCRVCLLDSSYNFITSYTVQGYPYSICVTDEDEVAVALPHEKTIQFLTVRNKTITPNRKFTTEYQCESVTVAGNGDIVVSGPYGSFGLDYWSRVTRGGQVLSYHPTDRELYGFSNTNVAVNSSGSDVYLSIARADTLYFFGFDGSRKFLYRHELLRRPRGVATDRSDNVLVVGQATSTIHHLTKDGAVKQIIKEGIPHKPKAICFKKDTDEFLITNSSEERRKLCLFRLQ